MPGSARDPAPGILYLVGEYCGEAEVPMHVAAIQAHGDWITGVIDPAARRNQEDGYRVREIYRKHGLRLEAVFSPVEAGILELQNRMSSGRLKVFPRW